MTKAEVHLVPTKLRRGWLIRVVGGSHGIHGDRLLKTFFPTKLGGRRAGRAIAELLSAEFIPHRRDGRIEKFGRATFPRSSDSPRHPG